MNTPQTPENHAGATFSTRRVLPYSPQQVFDAFANPDVLARWWGPNGFTNTFELFEFAPGGRWKFMMHGPDGTHYQNESVFLKLDSPSTIVIQHVSQPHFTLTVTIAANNGGTEIAWNQEFESSEVADRIRHIVEPANEQNLDRLHAVLEQRV
ncbi:SRPBCC domain-containing protein [Noviherbaspirillum denitrificans]|uniref:Polyketide cyclase n=1 Tax=Noviherbaspirillum denitrificans TaxID=1968433 RepID=A0A254TCU6_9BURK|nr:SRPBCC domain-containing protein [Noviherbaspirillum denitrificans]OWW20461.1 polyketide cyclase [Noviherbaspirillum denitrificans]